VVNLSFQLKDINEQRQGAGIMNIGTLLISQFSN
jgi:hypothetical protein